MSTVGKLNDQGYTLIELSVVVLLIGLMLLMAVPRVRDTLLTDNLKAATRQIVGASRNLRNDAIREQVDYILRIDMSRPGFWSHSADTTAEKLVTVQKAAIRFPKGIRITGVRHAGQSRKTDGVAFIRFFREGYTEPAIIHIEEDERIFTLVFNPFLPTVGVYEEFVDFIFNEDDRAAAF